MKPALCTLFTLPFFLLAQPKGTPIKLSDFDPSLLETEILIHINHHRDSLGLSLLSVDQPLREAALDQSDYQLRKGLLTHEQVTLRKETPFRRVSFYGEGKYSLVGENCAYLPLRKNINTYEKMGFAFWKSWRNSPPHYANIITAAYQKSGIRFAIDRDKKRIYGTHVFGGPPYLPPKGVDIPAIPYDILPYNKKKCKALKVYGSTAEVLANYLSVKDDSIFINIYDLDYMKQMFDHPNDAIAIDIVEKRQFDCGKPNMLFGAETHDGIMLPPVYRYELFKNNRTEKSLYSYLGKIPKGLTGPYQLNTMILKENCVCRNTSTVSVPSGFLPYFRLPPYFILKEGIIEADSFSAHKTFEAFFEKSKSEFETPSFDRMMILMGNYAPFIKKVHIHAFSSVEGSEEINLTLQEERAKSVIQKFEAKGIRNAEISFEAEENWDLFYQQIDTTEFNFLKEKSKEEVKEMLKDTAFQRKLEPFLSKQRMATVDIDASGNWDENEIKKEYLPLAFEKAITKKDFEQALSVQTEFITEFWEENEGLYYSDFSPEWKALLSEMKASVPYSYESRDVLNNTLALELLDPYIPYWDSSKVNLLLELLIRSEDTGLNPFKYNLYHYLTLRLEASTSKVFTPVNLLQDLHLMQEADSASSESVWLSRLLVNFHLSAIPYYYKRKKYHMKRKSMKAIRKHFVTADLSEGDALRLARFFNHNFYFDWTVEVLEPWAKLPSVEEETLFAFVKTLSLTMDISNMEYLDWTRRAYEKNPKRWCDWMVTYFQFRKSPGIKEVYCDKCQ